MANFGAFCDIHIYWTYYIWEPRPVLQSRRTVNENKKQCCNFFVVNRDKDLK